MQRRITRNSSAFKKMAVTAWLSAALAMGGCAGYEGVELQGGVFDALGLSGSGQKRMADTKLEPRPGLVLPPKVDKLPDPVTGSIATAPQGESWPVDPEDKRAASRAELDKRHAEFCERAIMMARSRGESGVIMGPKGNCQPGLFGSLTQQVEGR